MAGLGPKSKAEVTERNTLLAIASAAEAASSVPTQRSLGNVDESLLNYELIDHLVSYILRTERTHGPQALVGQVVAAGHSRLGAGQLGAVLVFLPGMAEIRKCARFLQNSMRLDESEVGPLWILPLHGSLSSMDQKKVFQRPPPGVRKIVLSTNVAETSVTIEDVVYVVDSGRHKEMMFDAGRGLACLEDAWVSRASARQRKGRAGRVQVSELSVTFLLNPAFNQAHFRATEDAWVSQGTRRPRAGEPKRFCRYRFSLPAT